MTDRYAELGPEVIAEESEATPVPTPITRSETCLIVLASLAVVAAIHAAQVLLIPVVLSLLMALLMRPLLRRMRRYRLPDLLSAFLLTTAAAMIFVGIVLTIAGQAQEWLSEAPATLHKVGAMLPSGDGLFGDIIKTQTAVKELTKTDGADEPLAVEMKSPDGLYAVLGGSGHFLGSVVIVFVLCFFFLGFSDVLLNQLVQSRGSFEKKREVVQLVQNIENGISRYLFTITVINCGLGVATAATMWLLKVPNPMLWGVMAATLNYVPHVGAFLCMIVLFFVGAVTHESIGYGAFAAGMFAILTAVESYFITPMVLSRSLQLSPLAVILAVLFWGWLWGIAGGLLAAPLLAVLKIVCDQFAPMHGLAVFLAGESPPRPNDDEATQNV